MNNINKKTIFKEENIEILKILKQKKCDNINNSDNINNINNIENIENIERNDINENNILEYKITYSDYYVDLLNIYKIKFKIINENNIITYINGINNINNTINSANGKINDENRIVNNMNSNNEKKYIVIDNTYEIISLEEYIKYNQYDVFDIEEDTILKILYDIGFIIKLLERENKAIFSILIKDIIVINNNIFLFINKNKIFNINKKNIYYFNKLSYDEILRLPINISNNRPIKTLPIKVYYNNIYYSFGILLLNLLYYSKKQNYITNMNCISILNSLKKYKNSGIYYFIKRCLQEDIEKRALLYL